MVARHVGQFGWVCPGDGSDHPAHATHDLTCDHVLPIIEGGAPFDPANTRILCRSRNSANGARLVNSRGSIKTDPPSASPDPRAAIRSRFL
jgi:5-methylcytosine-specific restriction endonuclease McrA